MIIETMNPERNKPAIQGQFTIILRRFKNSNFRIWGIEIRREDFILEPGLLKKLTFARYLSKKAFTLEADHGRGRIQILSVFIRSK